MGESSLLWVCVRFECVPQCFTCWELHPPHNGIDGDGAFKRWGPGG